MNDEILYVWLISIKGIGSTLATKLLIYFGTVENIYNAKIDNLIKVNKIGENLAKEIFGNKDLDHAKSICEYCYENNIKILLKGKNTYPINLRFFEYALIVLYLKGSLRDLTNSVAIVGARRCSNYGKQVTIELAEELSKYKIPVISGMAKGIDSYTHTAVIKSNGYTIAVLGTGVEKCYPIEHLPLMNKIIEHGAVISQFEPKSSVSKINFVKRNELIAMLSSKIVVTEAGKNSGALITAAYGFKNKKILYAVPSNIYESCNEGCNNLISQGAKIYLSPHNIIEGMINNKSINSKFYMEEENISDIGKQIMELIMKEPLSVDKIKSILNNGVSDIEEILFNMELMDKIKQIVGVYKFQ